MSTKNKDPYWNVPVLESCNLDGDTPAPEGMVFACSSPQGYGLSAKSELDAFKSARADGKAGVYLLHLVPDSAQIDNPQVDHKPLLRWSGEDPRIRLQYARINCMW